MAKISHRALFSNDPKTASIGPPSWARTPCNAEPPRSGSKDDSLPAGPGARSSIGKWLPLASCGDFAGRVRPRRGSDRTGAQYGEAEDAGDQGCREDAHLGFGDG